VKRGFVLARRTQKYFVVCRRSNTYCKRWKQTSMECSGVK